MQGQCRNHAHDNYGLTSDLLTSYISREGFCIGLYLSLGTRLACSCTEGNRVEGTARNRLVSYSMYIGTKIDLLGRCSSCVSGKRSVNYCRVQKLPKASPCVACYKTGFTTYKCRQELHHTTSNGISAVLLTVMALPITGKLHIRLHPYTL